MRRLRIKNIFRFTRRSLVGISQQHERSQVRRAIILSLLGFLAGPASAALYWALEVYVLNSGNYISFYERLEILIAVLPIGLIVGLAGSVFLFVRLAPK